jgi:hypothetical protein
MKISRLLVLLFFSLVSTIAQGQPDCYLLEPPLPISLDQDWESPLAGAPILCIEKISPIDYTVGLGKVRKYKLELNDSYRATLATDDPSSYIIENLESRSAPSLLKRVTFYRNPDAHFGAIKLTTPSPSHYSGPASSREVEHVYSYREIRSVRISKPNSFRKRHEYTPLPRMSWKAILLSDELHHESHILPNNLWLDFTFQNVNPDLIAKVNNEFFRTEEIFDGDPNANNSYTNCIIRYRNYGVHQATLYLGQVLRLKKSNPKLFRRLFGHPSTEVSWNYQRIAPK